LVDYVTVGKPAFLNPRAFGKRYSKEAMSRPASTQADTQPLSERERFLEAILESATDYAIIAMDLDGAVKRWNEGARRLLGWTEQEMLGQSGSRIFTPDDRGRGIPEVEMRNALELRRTADERWHVRMDGSHFWANCEMMPLRNSAGVAQGFLKILRDQTRAKEAEDERVRIAEALEASERRLRLAIDAGRLAVWEYDIISEEIVGSRDLNNLLGFPPGLKLGMDQVQAGYLPGERERLRRAGQAATAKGQKFFQQDLQYRRPDGQVRWLQLRAEIVSGSDPRPARVVGVLMDITDRKTSENTLHRENEELQVDRAKAEVVARKSETNFRLLIESVVDYAIYMLDPTGRVVSWNPGAERIKGYTSEEIIGESFSRFYTEEDRAAGIPDLALSTAAETGRFTAEAWRCRKDGSRFWASVVIDAIRDGGELVGFVKVTRDLTERRQTQIELEEAREQLFQLQKMEAVGQLTGGIAHDFNNLLTGISGSLEMIQTRLSQGRINDLQSYAMAAQGAATRAAALTHRLLAFSRRQTLDPKPTNINRLVSDLEDLIRRTVGPSIRIEVAGAVSLWTTFVDPPQLENALLNLCINARDAMPEGGKLTIETGNRWLDDGGARERELVSGQYVSLCVSDTGTGMSPELIARAFDPFFTTKPIGMGTGLGLSMIYGFAKQSSGAVRIYSEVGQGTTVCIYLPRHYGEEERTDVPVDRGGLARAEQGETVLVVDDEPNVRMLVTEILEDLGYTAIEASDGAAGLRVLQSEARVDLLVTDVGLPNGINGRQVADAGRVLRPGLKVLFITGFAENALLGHGHLDPGMQVMTKPFAMEALARRIKQIITG
jgi:PAS domain S-box-containing protein